LVTRSNSHKLKALISNLPNLNNEKTNGNVKITKITLEEEEPDVKESIKSRKSKISLNKENIKDNNINGYKLREKKNLNINRWKKYNSDSSDSEQ